MTPRTFRWLVPSLLLGLTMISTGCMTGRGSMFNRGACCDKGCDDGCEEGCESGSGCCLGGGCSLGGCFNRRTMAIPDVQPLGSVVRAHYHTMQTNAEAADFIFHRHEFVGHTAELTPAGKDHLVEVASRMRSAPFPVLVERSENNSDPELDAFRRDLVAQILTDFGNPDAHQRTVVSPAYGKGINSLEAEVDYYRFIFTRDSIGNQNNNGFGNSFGSGFGSSGGFGF